MTHHSFGKVGTASGVLRNRKSATWTGNGEEYETHYTAKIRKTPPPGSQPAPLSEVAGWQGRLVRHVVEDLGSVCPFVQILDLLVPQMVGDVTDTLRILDFPIAEQVIEVPKILVDVIPARSLIPEPQTAEQLVEVPTVLSPTRIALQIAEQIASIPAPRGRGQGFVPQQSSTASTSYLERISVDFPEQTVEQIVDISPGGGLGKGSASSAGLPGSANQGVRGFLPGQSSTQRIVEHLVDSSSGGLQDFHLGQGSAASPSGPADEAFTVVFRTFPRGKKCGVRSRPESQGARQWRPGTRDTYEDLGSADEPATQQDEDDELLLEEEEDPSGWFVSKAGSVVLSTGIGARAGLCGTSLLGPPRGGGRGGGRGRRGGRDDFLALRVLSFVTALVVESDSGMLSMLVFLVTYLFALSSFRLSSGLRCPASRPVWTRRTMARSSSILAVACARLVFLVSRLAVCSLWLSAGPQAGRYGPANESLDVLFRIPVAQLTPQAPSVWCC